MSITKTIYALLCYNFTHQRENTRIDEVITAFKEDMKMHSLLHVYILRTLLNQSLHIPACAAILGIKTETIISHIDDLKASGCAIQCIGEYAHLHHADPIYPIVDDRLQHIHMSIITSTQDILKSMPPRAHKTLVITSDSQLYGRGRYSKKWSSTYGHDVLMSMLIPYDKEAIPFSLIIGYLIKLWLNQRYAITGITLKWPNDILYNGLKICGILTEMHPSKTHWIIGIGLNIHKIATPLTQANPPIITLSEITEHTLKRQEVIHNIASTIHNVFSDTEMLRKMCDSIVEKFNASDVFHNKPVHVIETKKNIHGIGRGINTQGHYMIEQEDGVMLSVAAASIRLMTGRIV